VSLKLHRKFIADRPQCAEEGNRTWHSKTRKRSSVAPDQNAERAGRPHELYLGIRFKLNELKAYGMPCRRTWCNSSADLEAEFAAEKEDDRDVLVCDNVIATRASRSENFGSSRALRLHDSRRLKMRRQGSSPNGARSRAPLTAQRDGKRTATQ